MSKGLVNWILFVLLAITWGSSFILMKRGLDCFTSQEVASIRMFLAFLFMLPFAFMHYKTANLKKKWLPYAMVGLCGNLIPAFLFTKAQTGISSSTAGILNALTPLFVLLIAVVVYKNKFSRLNIIGILIGFAGALLLIMSNGNGTSSAKPELGFLIVIATALYGVAVNVIRNYLQDQHHIAITAFAFCSVGPLVSVYMFSSTEVVLKLQQNTEALSCLGYLSILAFWGTATAVMLYNYLIKQSTILFASSVTYAIPIVAVMWGLFDGEGLQTAQMLSIGIILGGVYLVTKKG